MINLLLRLYPPRWRARYGDEFAAVLEDRPLGPFDVADVLLGALDAHLHLRGLGAASAHGKGFTMSLRIGGYAAILGGVLWLYILAGNAINDGAEAGPPFMGAFIVGATVTTLVALAGLSAFQSRSRPVLTWTAFAVPAIGAVVGLLGFVAMFAAGDTDAKAFGVVSLWMVASTALLALVLGTGLFALATWTTRTLSRQASGLLAVGSVLTVVMLIGVSGGLVPEPLQVPMILVAIAAFPGGWVALGVSALRVAGPAPAPTGGAS